MLTPMRFTRGRMLRTGLILGVLAAACSKDAEAQSREERASCECVDRDGQRIENCFCFRAPDRNFGVFRLGPRARIGVSVEEDPDGARVADVVEDAPAEDAGIRVGDVIVSVDGQELLAPLADRSAERRLDIDGDVAVQRLMAVADTWEPGDDVSLVVVRDGRRIELEMNAEEAPDDLSVFSFGDGLGDRSWSFSLPEGRFRLRGDSLRGDFFGEGGGGRFRSVEPLVGALSLGSRDACPGGAGPWSSFGRDCVAGVRLLELNPDLGTYFGAESGVLVVEVSEESDLGLRAGDVLLQIDGRGVDDPDHARRILSSYRAGEAVTLTVIRRGDRVEVEGRR